MQRGKKTMKDKFKTIDEYLFALTEDKRAALQKLRKIIKSIAPHGEECISYRMPAFRIDGRVLLWFGAGPHHCAFYPGGVVEQYKKQLDGFSTSKGTIRFHPEHPLPAELVKKIVKARIAENRNRLSEGSRNVK
jgi:uncharacterized protein YdhG (YjbR/CyaY superfamily)